MKRIIEECLGKEKGIENKERKEVKGRWKVNLKIEDILRMRKWWIRKKEREKRYEERKGNFRD